MKNQLVNSGFTIIEMMIVVGIIAVLALIAFPSYQSSVEKNDLVDAKRSLILIRSQLESDKLAHPRNFMSENDYSTYLDNAAKGADSRVLGRYSLSGSVKAYSNNNQSFQVFLQASPTKNGYTRGVWIDKDGNAFNCKGLSGKASTSKPSNCEVL